MAEIMRFLDEMDATRDKRLNGKADGADKYRHDYWDYVEGE